MASHVVVRAVSCLILVAGAATVRPAPARAQLLDWEGRTGGVVAPFAGTTGALSGDGRALVAVFHLLDAGDVVGTHLQLSVTFGLAGRLEAGVTRSAVSVGRSIDASSLFDRGFTTVHAKVDLLREGAAGTMLPALSIGALYRWQHEHIGTEIRSDPTKNAEVYIVATRRIRIIEALRLVINGGARSTRAVFFGMAGNAAGRELRAFASGGLQAGPLFFAGAEWVQQPDHLDGVAEAAIPATATAFIRFTPSHRFGADIALVRLADAVAPGIDLAAGRAFLIGIGYRF